VQEIDHIRVSSLRCQMECRAALACGRVHIRSQGVKGVKTVNLAIVSRLVDRCDSIAVLGVNMRTEGCQVLDYTLGPPEGRPVHSSLAPHPSSIHIRAEGSQKLDRRGLVPQGRPLQGSLATVKWHLDAHPEGVELSNAAIMAELDSICQVPLQDGLQSNCRRCCCCWCIAMLP